MAWAEAALEEMGLAQIWVRAGRRGCRHGRGRDSQRTPPRKPVRWTPPAVATGRPARTARTPVQDDAPPAAARSADASPAREPAAARRAASTTAIARLHRLRRSRRPTRCRRWTTCRLPDPTISRGSMRRRRAIPCRWPKRGPSVRRLPRSTGMRWPRAWPTARCAVCAKRTNTVFGVGDREADWMLIGEAPGENEDKQGEPFVGEPASCSTTCCIRCRSSAATTCTSRT